MTPGVHARSPLNHTAMNYVVFHMTIELHNQHTTHQLNKYMQLPKEQIHA